jgi:hypothetical protein
MSISGPRILYTQIDGTTIDVDSEGNATSGTGFQTLPNNVSVARTFIDLEGYYQEDLTLFLQGSVVQDGMPFLGTATEGFCIDLITTEFVSNDEITTVLNAPATNQRQFGYFASTLSQQDIVYGVHRQFGQAGAASLTQPVVVIVSSTKFGTCDSTAGQRLHITRLVFATSAALPASLSVPQSNWVVTGILAEEDELQYLMRLRRSTDKQIN